MPNHHPDHDTDPGTNGDTADPDSEAAIAAAYAAMAAMAADRSEHICECLRHRRHRVVGDSDGQAHPRRPDTRPTENHRPQKGTHPVNTTITRTTSVWDALADTPAEAENLRIRSALLSSINDHITEKRWNADTTAGTLGVNHPRLAELSAGRIDRFTLDDLVSIGITIGIHLGVTHDRAQG